MRMPRLGPIATPNMMSLRVPVWVEDGVYTVQATDKLYRMYDDDTLPDFIKASMAMIKAFPFKVELASIYGWTDPRTMFGTDPTYENSNAYINRQDPKLDDIGWRVSENLFIVILTQDQLESMYGEDTRSEGQEQCNWHPQKPRSLLFLSVFWWIRRFRRP